MFNTPTRNHITVVIERLGLMFVMIAVIALNFIQQSVEGDFSNLFSPDFWRYMLDSAAQRSLPALVSAIALVVATFVFVFVSVRFWVRTFFYISGTDFIYTRSTLFKKTSRLPLQNIASVNLERSIFERIVGTAKVKLDLNSSRTADRTDFAFVLRLSEAEALRTELISLRDSARAGGAKPTARGTDNFGEVVHYSTGIALRHKLLSIPFMQTLTAVFAIVSAPFADSGSFDIKSFVALIAVTLAGGIFYIIRGSLNLGSYTVSTDGKVIRITCGVLRKSEYVFERDRINAVVVREPVLARIFGFSSVDVAVVGLGNEKNETPQLTLLTTRAETRRILSACAGDFMTDEPAEDSHPAALLWSGIWAAVMGIISWAVVRFGLLRPGVALAVGAGALALFLLRGYLAYKTKKIIVGGDVFCCISGIFSRKSGIFKYGDIQHTEIKTNFIMRRFGVATLRLSILAGSKMKNHSTGWFPVEHLERVAGSMTVNRGRDSISFSVTKGGGTVD